MQPIAFFYTPTLPHNSYYSPNTFQICYFPQMAAQYQLPILANSNSQHEHPINSQFSWKSFQTNLPLAQKQPLKAKPFTALISEDSDAQELEEVPETRRARGSAKQKFGRNILSNIFLMMVRFVQKSKKMKAHITKFIEANKLTIKISQFYNTIKRKSAKLRPYANEANITAFWRDPPLSQSSHARDQKQRQFSRIFRAVGRLYLNTYHIPYVYNTNKIKGESKRLHMGCIRRILHL